ncbi:MAG TPA: alpha/beta fold hydrolase [Clostridia bacterium]|nr:alpha/beta fold hydrolase [Clostridia bacterium]
MMSGLRREWFQLEEVRLHAMVAGPADGPLVLLLHGFPEFWYSWRHQIPALASAGFRVIAPDQRGYNLSDKPGELRAYTRERLAADVIGIADRLGRQRFALVGHDWGGIVAWEVASRFSGRVERIAIVNAPHPDVFGQYARRHLSQMLKSWYILFFQVPGLPEKLLSRREFAGLRRMLLSTSLPGTFSPQDIALYREAWSRSGALTAMIHWYRANARRTATAVTTPRIPCPTLLLWGEKDPALNAELARESLKVCDSGSVRMFPDATHWLHQEFPQEVNGELLRFLRAH